MPFVPCTLVRTGCVLPPGHTTIRRSSPTLFGALNPWAHLGADHASDLQQPPTSNILHLCTRAHTPSHTCTHTNDDTSPIVHQPYFGMSGWTRQTCCRRTIPSKLDA
mmetsp:Transcript_129820/g.224435  ORF Transcript_129820/g.224435 Transcript_129820/m.224435 type:complete len:107 (-) Transcript_129820:246-566(-)